MLRLPKFELVEPRTVAEALDALAQEGSMVVAGGTDLLPSMKHELFTPPRLVSLQRVDELRGVRELDGGWIAIGAMTTLADVASDERVHARAPALAQAASLVAGPQLRTMGTLGGNVLLDTRCQWYNQTYFWRQALGFCLKKDGTKCHVVEGGSKCVAAASNDTAPALMTLGATLVFESRNGRRVVPIDDLWLADGVNNKRVETGEILREVRVPAAAPGHRGAYGKLRERGSIDFPLFGVAVRVDLGPDGRVAACDVVTTALQARPLRLARAQSVLEGIDPRSEQFAPAVREIADRAYKQCHPLPNVPGDHEWRREMVPVYVERTLRAAIDRSGPVHHV